MAPLHRYHRGQLRLHGTTKKKKKKNKKADNPKGARHSKLVPVNLGFVTFVVFLAVRKRNRLMGYNFLDRSSCFSISLDRIPPFHYFYVPAFGLAP